MGGFVGGLDESKTCQSACEGIGMTKDTTTRSNGPACATVNGKYMPGTFKDVSSGVCCCN